MQIKIFKGTNIKKLEEEVNEFIKNKNVIDIKQSVGDYESVMGNPKGHIFITVLFN